MNKVLLYYKYTKIEDPEDLCTTQKELCKRLGLKGRILIAEEGINGTVAGPEEKINEYQKQTNAYPGLEDLEWKDSYTEATLDELFPKMRVVVREEIVTLGVKKSGKDVDIKNKAKYIEPKDLKKLYDDNEEFYIVDARSDYETNLGRFKNSVVFDVPTFRTLPKVVDRIEHLKDKPVVTICTGGVKCEKFSAFLKEQGFQNVRQLHGGVHRYGQEVGGENFEGELYVFDGRVQMKVNEVNPKIITKCHHCGTEVARYIDCHNAKCNKQIICCEDCEILHNKMCSEECNKLVMEHPEVRAYRKKEENQ